MEIGCDGRAMAVRWINRWIDGATLVRWHWPALLLLCALVGGILLERAWVLGGILWLSGFAVAGVSRTGRGILVGMGLLAVLGYWRMAWVEEMAMVRGVTGEILLAEEGLQGVGVGVVLPESVRTMPGGVVVRVERWDGLPARGRVLLAGRLPSVEPGDRLEVDARFEPLPPGRNPGSFDPSERFEVFGLRDQWSVERESGCRVVGRERLPIGWQTALWLRALVERNLPVEEPGVSEGVALMRALVLGDRSVLSLEWRERFRWTGTAHLFAVSGLHVGLVAGALYWILGGIGARNRWVRSLGAIFGVVLYCLMTGVSPSSLRATVMVAVVLLAVCLDRRPFQLNTLCVAAVVILALRPMDLWDAGFQLSFVVVFALLTLAPWWWGKLSFWLMSDPLLPRDLRSRGERCREAVALWGGGLVVANGAAWVGALLLSITYFHLVSPVGFVANLVLAPCAMVLLGLGLVGGLLGGLAGWLGAALKWLGTMVAGMVFGVVQMASEIPGGAWTVSWRELMPRPAVEMWVAEVRPGAGQLVRVGGAVWLVDAGGARGMRWDLLPLLRWDGVRRLDGLVLSQGRVGVYGGAAEVVRRLDPLRIVETAAPDRSRTRRAFLEEMAGEGRVVERVWAGAQWSIGKGVAMRVWHPPEGWSDPLAANKGLVVGIETESGRLLLLGDLGLAGMRQLGNQETDLRAEVVVVGEDRVDPLYETSWVEQVRPRLIVVRRGDRFGDARLRRSWLERLRRYGIPVWDQEETGAVRVWLTRGRWAAESWVTSERMEWVADGMADGMAVEHRPGRINE